MMHPEGLEPMMPPTLPHPTPPQLNSTHMALRQRRETLPRARTDQLQALSRDRTFTNLPIPVRREHTTCTSVTTHRCSGAMMERGAHDKISHHTQTNDNEKEREAVPGSIKF